MLYTEGFLLAGALATAITLAALAELPVRAGGRAPDEAPVGAGDLEALGRLGAAVEARSFRRDRLDEPDFDVAEEALDAAELAEGRVRDGLRRLADAASRSALEFLVDYNLSAGRWEAATGLRLPAAVPASASASASA